MVVGHVLSYTTRDRFELINLTQQVEELVGKVVFAKAWPSCNRFIPLQPYL